MTAHLPRTQAARLHLVRDDQPSLPARPRRALALIANRKTLRTVARVMRAAGAELVTCEDVAQLRRSLDGAAVDVIVVDPEGAQPKERLAAELQEIGGLASPPAVVLLSDQLMDGSLAQLVSRSSCRNVLAKVTHGTCIDVGELLLTVRKIFDRDVFGPEKYVRWGSILHSIKLTQSDQKHEVLGQLQRFLEELECESRLLHQLQTVADEFVMNAFYNAPVAADGSRPYAALPRTQRVTLDAEQAATFEFCTDGKVVALSCRDPFGSLSPRRMSEAFSRAMDSGPNQVTFTGGGAGIGLYMIYRFVDQMIVNIEPNRQTEFIGVVDMTRPFRERSASPKSVHVFVVGS